MIEVAWAAVKKKGSYYREKYKELGADYLVNKNKKQKMTKIRRAAKELGFELVAIAK